MRKSTHTNDYKALAKWLKTARENKGLTQRELADKMKVHHSVIWKVEACERRLDLIQYRDYCKALSVDPIEGLKIIIKN